MKKWLRLLPVAAALCCLALFWCTGLGDSPYAWGDLALDRGVWGMEFAGNKLSFDAQAGECYGAVSAGPHLDLPAGTYSLRYFVETDAENSIEIVSANGAQIEPSRIALHAPGWMAQTEIELKEDAQDLQIVLNFDAGTRFAVHSLKLVSPAYTDRAWLATFAVLGALMVYALWLCGGLTKKRVMTLVLLGTAVVFASMPALKADLTLGYDSVFHLARLRNLVSAWAQGQFPARVGVFTYNGYGSATSAMYPDLFFALPALMLMTGASLQLAMHTLIVFVNIATAGMMYLLAARLFQRESAAVGAATLYTLASYRLTDLYARAALGEALGMAFMPLFLLGLYEVLAGDKRRWPLLALGATCVFQSHMLTTAICALLALLCGALCIRKVWAEGRLWPIVKAAGLTLLVNLFFLVPFLSLGQMGLSDTVPPGSCEKAALAPAQLLAGMFVWDRSLGAWAETHHLKDFPVDIGVPLVLGALLALRACLYGGKGEGRRRGLFLLGLGAASALMCTTLFPWGALARVSGGLSDVIQFPWRMLMLTDLFFALAAGYGLAALEKEGEHTVQAAALALCLVCAMPMLTGAALSTDVLAYGETVPSLIGYTDYTIPGTDIDLAADDALLTEGGVAASLADRDGTTLYMDVEAKEDGVITLPLFAYKGYAAQIGGQEIALGTGENNRLTAFVPAGASGRMTVFYRGETIWRAADAISLASILLFACFSIICVMNMKKMHAKN